MAVTLQSVLDEAKKAGKAVDATSVAFTLGFAAGNAAVAAASAGPALPAPSSSKPKVLLVLTSNDKLGTTGQATGWYLPEAAHPYMHFKRAGFSVSFASIAGGKAPLDASSINLKDADNKVFYEGEGLKEASASVKLSSCKAADYDCVLFVGGFGTMWDFPDDADVQRMARGVYENGGVTSAVCHGPCALVNVKLSSGEYLCAGQEVTAFTNAEEDAVKRRDVVPFTCEDALTKIGGKFVDGGVFKPQVCIGRGGRLITGQNPPSAGPLAAAIIKVLSK